MITFLYLSITSFLSIFFYNELQVTNINTYDKNFNTDQDFYYKKMHLILYMQIYTNLGEILSEQETDRVFNYYLETQVSKIESSKFFYQKSSLSDFSCGIKQISNLLFFCIDYDINNLNDFLFVSFKKSVLIGQNEFDNFFKNYSIRIYADYYFTRPCESFYFFNVSQLESYLQEGNKIFMKNKLDDYVKNSAGTFNLRINSTTISPMGNNIILLFKTLKLQLDAGNLLTDIYKFNSFQFDSQQYSFNSNLFTLTFKLSPEIETFKFKYKKLQESFAEISGIMSVIRFFGLFFILIINFFKQYIYFANKVFKRKIIFIKDLQVENNPFVSVKKQSGLVYLKSDESNKHTQKQLRQQTSLRKPGMDEKKKSNVQFNVPPQLYLEEQSQKSVFNTNFLMLRESNLLKLGNEKQLNKTQTIKDQDFSNNSIIKRLKIQIDGAYEINKDLKLIKSDMNRNKLHSENEEIHIKNKGTRNNSKKLHTAKLSLSPMKLVQHKTDRLSQKINDYILFTSKKQATHKFSVYEIIKVLMFSKCSKTRRTSKIILLQMIERSMKKMDFFKVVKASQRLDILEYLLLDERQNALLKYIDKEQILFNKDNKESTFVAKYKPLLNSEEKAELVQNFFQYMKNDNDPSLVDRKLYAILDESLLDLNTEF
jgi:hypothetical protein